MRLGLALALGSSQRLASVFDPATEDLTGFWRADFPGTPWPGTASAGASGSRSLTDATGNTPTAGTALNGRTPASFNGTTHRIAAALGVSTFLPAGGAGLAVLMNASAAAADQALFYNAPALVSSTSAVRFALTHSASGVRAGIYNGSDFSAVTPYAACAPGTWRWVFCWWDATTLYVQVENGTPQSVTIGGSGATPDAFVLRVGCNYSAAAFYAGQIADIQTRASAWSAGDITNRRAYGASQYAL